MLGAHPSRGQDDKNRAKKTCCHYHIIRVLEPTGETIVDCTFQHSTFQEWQVVVSRKVVSLLRGSNGEKITRSDFMLGHRPRFVYGIFLPPRDTVLVQKNFHGLTLKLRLIIRREMVRRTCLSGSVAFQGEFWRFNRQSVHDCCTKGTHPHFFFHWFCFWRLAGRKELTGLEDCSFAVSNFLWIIRLPLPTWSSPLQSFIRKIVFIRFSNQI